MGLDYYNILEISKSAKDAEIKKAYRKLGPIFHPERNKGDLLAAERFNNICESYDVLSDARKKAIYDQFGEEGLKSGVPISSNPAGAWTQGYTYHGNSKKVFHDFFGGDNPFSEYFDQADGDMVMGFGGLYGRSAKTQDDSIVNDLPLTLEEMYFGCVKKMKISRRVLANSPFLRF
ncbi:dnaJ homolog subfamily B member 13-like [Octopus sinensis]|uniref:DnaJ homolog subfamily B member 13-like n=1 Tax=Octopus sinensis TaxID=2607531 RepID=A0A6P7U2F5_9MOLL|nr:dnaJ homolog subfamily B member 13-like [Octopus sinensis]